MNEKKNDNAWILKTKNLLRRCHDPKFEKHWMGLRLEIGIWL